METLNEPGALYVSSNSKEGPVTRYGLGSSPGTFNYIGATRTAATGAKNIIFDEELVVKIPAAEARRYLAEYSRAIRSGALIVREFSDYAAQQKAEAEALEKEEKAEEARLEKLARDAEDAAKKAADAQKTMGAKPPTDS